MTCWLASRTRPLFFATLVIGSLIACSVAPNRSEAQALYYRTLPIGERAVGMGGAFTGIANDPSATYYNPAGMMAGGRFQLLGSLASIVFTRRTVDNAFDSPNVDADFTSTGTTTLPQFIGTVVKLGREKFGDRQFALGYSTFEVERERLGVGLTSVDSAASVDLLLNSNYVMRWWGVSFAAQVTKKASVGLSAFASRQRGGYTEDIGLAVGGTLDAAGRRVGGDSITSTTRISMEAWDIVLRLGALHRFNTRWQLGLMLQLPGIPVSKKGGVFRRLTQAVSGADSAYFLFDESDLSVRVPIPFELRAGFEYKANALTTLSFDAAVTGPVRDRAVFDRPSQLENLDGRLGAYFANSTERRWTPNLAVGAEHLFGKAVVAGGLFTNISAAPDVPETSTEYVPHQVSIYGASVSVGVDTKGYRLTVGANGYFGRGDALAFALDRDAQVTFYQRTKSTVAALVLYVAGAVQVASKGAKEVEGKYKERRAKKKGEEPEEGEEESPSDGEPETDAEPEAGAEPETDAEPEAEAPSEQSPENPE